MERPHHGDEVTSRRRPPPYAATVAEATVNLSAYHERLAREATACICPGCISVDLMPSGRLRAVSPLAEFVARRLDLLGSALAISQGGWPQDDPNRPLSYDELYGVAC